MIKLLALLFLVFLSFLIVHPANALYFFGGRITSILPPNPFGPCPTFSITVSGPRPGLFLIPALKFYLFRIIRPGAWVLGSAANSSCGQIFYMGTSY